MDIGHCGKVRTKPKMFSCNDGSHTLCVCSVPASVRILSEHLKNLKISLSTVIIKWSLLCFNSSHSLRFILFLLNRIVC